MKRNKDYLYFILSEIEGDYLESLTFTKIFKKWMKVEPRSEEECKDFIFANDLLTNDAFIEAKNVSADGTKVIGVLFVTWKGFDLLDQLRADWCVTG
jgi:hypothetical protein